MLPTFDDGLSVHNGKPILEISRCFVSRLFGRTIFILESGVEFAFLARQAPGSWVGFCLDERRLPPELEVVCAHRLQFLHGRDQPVDAHDLTALSTTGFSDWQREWI